MVLLVTLFLGLRHFHWPLQIIESALACMDLPLLYTTLSSNLYKGAPKSANY